MNASISAFFRSILFGANLKVLFAFLYNFQGSSTLSVGYDCLLESCGSDREFHSIGQYCSHPTALRGDFGLRGSRTGA
jgi:hypothetical protein